MLETTPNANRPHIGLFGRRNAGKSSLLNAITGQNVALVSATPGSTTDPVLKAMELLPLGPVVFVDTAGLDDSADELGLLRVRKSREAMNGVNVALMVIPPSVRDFSLEKVWIKELKEREIAPILVISHADTLVMEDRAALLAALNAADSVLFVDSSTGSGINELKKAIVAASRATVRETPLISDRLKPHALVLLVMPQDKQAPKGRLILPQAQIIRELLDYEHRVLAVVTDELESAIDALKSPPDLVIVDSQVFQTVASRIPENWPLTSFSILMATRKGDLNVYLEGAKKIEKLIPGDEVLILEACSHHAMKNDIGREQIPKLLSAKAGGPVNATIFSGGDLPENFDKYKLVVQCGSCMITGAQSMNRLRALRRAGVSVTNYGLCLAASAGILDRAVAPLLKPVGQ